jgi:3-methyladenine DNA glycosylase AlkD
MTMAIKQSILTASEYYEAVSREMAQTSDPAYAEKQSKYMKHHFAFFGLKADQWLLIARDTHMRYGVPSGHALADFVQYCYEDDYREMQYFALQTLERRIKEQDAGYIDQLEYLITTKSWWDSVDWLAKLVGVFFNKHPQLIKPVTERWMASGHLWLMRTCLIFQLRYRDKTDTALMFRYILQVAESKEFFLRKGAGWALRQHTRTDAGVIQAFVAENADILSPLTKREALRLLKE